MNRVFALLLLVGSVTLGAERAEAEDYSEALREARKLGKRGKLTAALAAAERAVELAEEPLGGRRAAKAAMMAAKLAKGAKDTKTALKWAKRASHLANEDRRQRSRALSYRRSLDKSSRQRARVEALKKADRLAWTRQRWPAVGRSKLAATKRDLRAAARLYRLDGDEQRAFYAETVSMLVSVRSDKRSTRKRSVWMKPAEEWAPYVRKVAHEGLRQAALREKDAEEEATQAHLLNAIHYASKAEQTRRFSRLWILKAACRRYEKEAGAGACAMLGKRVTGAFNFDDPSRRRVRSLTPISIQRSQAQYMPALQDCIRTAVADNPDDPLFDNEKVKIEWAVTAKGGTGEVTLIPGRYDAIFGDCVKERIAWFRYPRARDGESMTVTVPFTMSSRWVQR